MPRELEDIRNYCLMVERIGTAGQPTREQFAAIAAAGFSTVINLAMPDHPETIRDEGAIVAGLGMSYVRCGTFAISWTCSMARGYLSTAS